MKKNSNPHLYKEFRKKSDYIVKLTPIAIANISSGNYGFVFKDFGVLGSKRTINISDFYRDYEIL